MLADNVSARGGCDLAATMHYLGQNAGQIVLECNLARDDVDVRIDHSLFLRSALLGIDRDTLFAFQQLGYRAEDLSTTLFTDREGKNVWLLSFWQESEMALYKHRETGVLVPFGVPGVWARNDATQLSADDLEPRYRHGWIAKALETLQQQFEYVGVITEPVFKETLHMILRARPPGAQTFIVGQNDRALSADTGQLMYYKECSAVNRWISEVCSEYDDVYVIPIRDCIQDEGEVIDWRHFSRMVYFRLYGRIASVLGQRERSA